MIIKFLIAIYLLLGVIVAYVIYSSCYAVTKELKRKGKTVKYTLPILLRIALIVLFYPILLIVFLLNEYLDTLVD